MKFSDGLTHMLLGATIGFTAVLAAREATIWHDARQTLAALGCEQSEEAHIERLGCITVREDMKQRLLTFDGLIQPRIR